MTKETWVGLAASVLTTVSLIPQLVKLIWEKKRKGFPCNGLRYCFAASAVGFTMGF